MNSKINYDTDDTLSTLFSKTWTTETKVMVKRNLKFPEILVPGVLRNWRSASGWERHVQGTKRNLVSPSLLPASEPHRCFCNLRYSTRARYQLLIHNTVTYGTTTSIRTLRECQLKTQYFSILNNKVGCLRRNKVYDAQCARRSQPRG